MTKKYEELEKLVGEIEDHLSEHCDMVEDLDDRVENLETYNNVTVAQFDDHDTRFQHVAEVLSEQEEEFNVNNARISELEEKVVVLTALVKESLYGKTLEGFRGVGSNPLNTMQT